jgi:hypothetical protein
VESTSPLIFTPGAFEEVEKLLQQRTKYLRISFPKELASLGEKKLVSHLKMESFQNNDGELKTYFDIDGLFGFIPCSIVNPFLLSLFICINTIEKPEIIISVKLGEVYTYFSRIGLNMNTILTINYSLIMYVTLSKKNQSTKEF